MRWTFHLRYRALLYMSGIFLAGLIPGIANADCVCTCVNGRAQALCSSSFELPPICPPTICPIVPPSIRPITPPSVPPVGTSSCGPEQVLNPYTGQYEWQIVCN